MQAPELKSAITESMTQIATHSDELRDLDAALGDGDLGITISSGAKAVVTALETLDDTVTPAEIAKACAKAFANANPSTMAALVAGALLAGSKAWADKPEIGQVEAVEFGRAAAESISKRGKSEVGDKTVLDALVPAVEALAAAPDGVAGLRSAIAAAEKGVVDTKGLQSRRGRASWLQERSIGLQDPGATALLRFLESWPTPRA
ncbi:DAK2 domain-containing protein [Nocardioides sp. LHG3406-4]|uniref:DAK2 domain-containing protein n=1 Tax=Nocardioides sp. LHG3406-4 TaxID=2804575 RepID=UPI003CFB9975